MDIPNRYLLLVAVSISHIKINGRLFVRLTETMDGYSSKLIHTKTNQLNPLPPYKSRIHSIQNDGVHVSLMDRMGFNFIVHATSFASLHMNIAYNFVCMAQTR